MSGKGDEKGAATVKKEPPQAKNKPAKKDEPKREQKKAEKTEEKQKEEEIEENPKGEENGAGDFEYDVDVPDNYIASKEKGKSLFARMSVKNVEELKKKKFGNTSLTKAKRVAKVRTNGSEKLDPICAMAMIQFSKENDEEVIDGMIGTLSGYKGMTESDYNSKKFETVDSDGKVVYTRDEAGKFMSYYAMVKEMARIEGIIADVTPTNVCLATVREFENFMEAKEYTRTTLLEDYPLIIQKRVWGKFENADQIKMRLTKYCTKYFGWGETIVVIEDPTAFFKEEVPCFTALAETLEYRRNEEDKIDCHKHMLKCYQMQCYALNEYGLDYKWMEELEAEKVSALNTMWKDNVQTLKTTLGGFKALGPKQKGGKVSGAIDAPNKTGQTGDSKVLLFSANIVRPKKSLTLTILLRRSTAGESTKSLFNDIPFDNKKLAESFAKKVENGNALLAQWTNGKGVIN